MPAKKKSVKKKSGAKKNKPKKKIGTSFTEAELRKFAGVINKIRKNKRGVKKKKVGLTNMSSFMNLLYNADRERKYAHYQRRYPYAYRRRYPYGYKRRNLMRAHPFRYPSMIEDADVNAIWNATKLPRGRKSKDGIITDLNQVYRTLVGFNLLKSPMPALGSINVVGPDANKSEPPRAPRAPLAPPRAPPRALPKAPSPAPPRALPKAPSQAPPRAPSKSPSPAPQRAYDVYGSVSETESSSEED